MVMMKKTVFLLLLACCAALEAKITVVASIMPLADWVRNIGGSEVVVSTVLRPGESPHTFTPKPGQMFLFAKAGLFVETGLGLEFWADKMVKASANTNMVRLVLGDLVKNPIRGEEAQEGGVNPHVWLSVRNAVLFCGAIRDALCGLDPAHAADFKRNCDNYVKVLNLLDKRIGDRLRSLQVKEFVCFHPAFVYFERDYGLSHIAIEEVPGRNPSPLEMVRVINEVKRIRARAVFIEPQLDPKAGRVIAKETGAAVEMLDPEGGFPGRDTYIGLMEFNLAQLTKALSGTPGAAEEIKR